MSETRDVSISVLSGVAAVLIFMGLCNGTPDVIDALGARIAQMDLPEYMAMRERRE